MRPVAVFCLVSLLFCLVPAAFGEQGNEESFRTALRYIRAFMDKIVNAPPEKGFFERILDFLQEVGFFRPGNETTAGLPAAGTAHA